MSRERDCKWHFGKETGREQLSDPMSDHFGRLFTGIGMIHESLNFDVED